MHAFPARGGSLFATHGGIELEYSGGNGASTSGIVTATSSCVRRSVSERGATACAHASRNGRGQSIFMEIERFKAQRSAGNLRRVRSRPQSFLSRGQLNRCSCAHRAL